MSQASVNDNENYNTIIEGVNIVSRFGMSRSFPAPQRNKVSLKMAHGPHLNLESESQVDVTSGQS